MSKLFTIGHGTKTIEQLIKKLEDNKIDVLVDVRSIPYSRKNPQFNADAITRAFTKTKMLYLQKGRNLGGLRENVDFDETLDWLADLCTKKNVCVMCSESNPEECHRKSKLQQPMEERGVEVEHILWKSTKEKPQSLNLMLF